ncbi:MAG: bifunctional lysylphosphatidylglycerol flippase/synthetase MprF [Steroidobacteraceae bacterium]
MQPESSRLRWMGALLPFAVFIAVIWVLHHELGKLQAGDILAVARQIDAKVMVLAALLTALSYLILAVYDPLALRAIGAKVRWRYATLASFIAYAIGHNLSMAALTGAAVRYRWYAPVGLGVAEVALVTAFNSVTTALGFISLAAISLLSGQSSADSVLHVHGGWARAVGIALACIPVGYLALTARRERSLEILGWSIPSPGIAIATLQLSLAILDMCVAAGVLWCLLPSGGDLSFIAFAGTFAVAAVAGVLSHVPAGLGVFESVVLLTLPNLPRDALLASLLLYRLIYYLVPLLIAGAIFAVRELSAHRERLRLMQRVTTTYIGAIAPQLGAGLVFAAAVVLLFSGATPAIDTRLAGLKRLLPLPILEFSHLAGSVIGIVLLILARALLRRVRAAYHLTQILLGIGMAASILKGFDYEEALLLALVATFLHIGRAAFYRKSPLLQERFTPGWAVTLVAVVVAVLWVAVLAHRDVSYSSELWWTFAFKSDASRVLRASLAVVIITALFLSANLLGPARPDDSDDEAGQLRIARGILPLARHSLAFAVLSEDKRLLLTPSQDAFIMYQVVNRSWVALGDPVGSAAQFANLIWRFRELSDQHGGRTVFYQVSDEYLPLYVDLGLAALKIGEEAQVYLPEFSLDGSARAELRQARRRAERDGATFEVLPRDQSAGLMQDLRRLSDQWLAEKSTAEKGFSVGRFSEDYMSEFPIALVRREGEPAAFANLWATSGKEELSVDLMRFGNDAPRGAMDFLFIELMLWGRAQGYRWFNLGMAPLSGLGAHPLSPVWHKVGNFVYRHGEHFYNFSGLRRYKSKFDPRWQPRYLVAHGGLALPRIVSDLSILVAGGLRAVVSK